LADHLQTPVVVQAVRAQAAQAAQPHRR
jgi:hypothetical protein